MGSEGALIVGAPAELRAELRGRSTIRQIQHCASLRERPTRSLEHRATVHALRATAQRIRYLQAEADPRQRRLHPADLRPRHPRHGQGRAATVADLTLGGTQKGPGTSVPDPSANKAANNSPLSHSPIKEVKGERPAQS